MSTKKKSSKKKSAKPKVKHHVHGKHPKHVHRKPGEKVYHRVCAYAPCSKKFTTTDERQMYDRRICGSKNRSKRWYKKVALAWKEMRKAEKKAAKKH